MRTLAAIAIAAFASFAAAGSTAASGVDRYRDTVGWTIAYPAALHLEHSSAQFRLSWYETTLATFQPVSPIHGKRTPSGESWGLDPPADAHGRFPANAAALRIFRSEGGPAPNVDVPETRLPVHLSDLRPAQYSQGSIRPLELRIEANGLAYVIDAWLGPSAPSATRAIIDRTLASLSFPALRPGQTVGHGFVVMRRPSAYRVGSFTRIRIAGEPYYLVRAPGGFYTLGWGWATLSGGYKSRCHVAYRAASRTFSCPNLGARWDRIGRVLTRPLGARVADPLNLSPAHVSQEGHVLVAPGVAMSAGREQARRFWPGWRD